MPTDAALSLSSARQAGVDAARAGTRHLLPTHLWPGSDPDATVRAAREAYRGPIDVAWPGQVVDLA